MRRCGKSSIQNVVFHKMSPNETLFLESTTKVGKDHVMSFLYFQVWDFPGHVDLNDASFDASSTFARCDTVVYIIDCQDEIIEPMRKLYQTVTRAHEVNPGISFEVFLHKVDGLSDDHKIVTPSPHHFILFHSIDIPNPVVTNSQHATETQREIHQRITDDLADAGLDNIHLSFYLTSIYDHSIFEAFSKVLQKLIPQLPTLENLLNILCSNSGIEKAFLFDTFSKVYIATDSSPVDTQSFELCSDMIDVVIDFDAIYGRLGAHHAPPPPSAQSHPRNGSAASAKTATTQPDAILPSSPVKEDAGTVATPVSAVATSALKGDVGPRDAYSVLNIGNGMMLYLRPVDKNLSLVCLIREDNFEKKGLIDYNFGIFKEAILEVLEVRRRGFELSE
ncbi:hypothetical protein HK101_010060 [Irineochytrium annulatum]|nr:hypothetical protein HK101_010060 [Irineochytrium annulatum]